MRIKAILFILTGIFFLQSFSGYSQVSGVSSSKLVVPNAYTVPFHHSEIEPSFSYLMSKKGFSSYGKQFYYSPNKDSIDITSDLYLRFTYGLTQDMEVGTIMTTDLSSLSFGSKYTFLRNKKFAGALLLGINFINNRLSFLALPATSEPWRTTSIAYGITFTNQFSERLSLDTDVQLQNTLANGSNYSNELFAHSEIGYYIFNQQLQLIGGLDFHYKNRLYDRFSDFGLIFNTGVTIETGKNYLIVIYTPVAIAGRNTAIYYGINMAFTISLH